MVRFNGLLPHQQLDEYKRYGVCLSHEEKCVSVENSLTGIVCSFRSDVQHDTLRSVASALVALTDVADDFDARRVALVVDRALSIRRFEEDEGR